MFDPLWQQDAHDLASQLTSGALSPVDLLEHFLERIERLNPALNAIVCLNENAMADARASAARHAAKRPLSLFDGIPVLIKDNLVVGGLPATWGSKLYEHNIPAADEIPVEKLRLAGCILLGKTNVPEFTVEGYTDNPLFGVTCNPWDLATTPGGSSGGSVAALAAGLAPLSIGTDGGGSIRRPAAYTNLVGLKTTLGRIPRGGGLPQLLLDMEVIGPLSRTVRDQALLFDVLAGPDARDHRSLRFAPARSLAQLETPPRPLKIRAVETFDAAPLDPDIRASFRQMVGLMEQMGHPVETGDLPLNIQAITDNWASIGNISLGLLLERNPEMRHLATQKYVDWAETSYPASHLLDVIEQITALRHQASEVFETLDIIMTPTCAAMPWGTDIPFPPKIDNQPIGPRGSAVYTGWVNATGHPAISVPGQMSTNGMPIGIQFVANLGADELLLRLARQIEIRQSWLDQWPEIAFSGPHRTEAKTHAPHAKYAPTNDT